MKKIMIWCYRKITFKYVFSFIEQEPDIDDWVSFLSQLTSAEDDFTLSYNKYLCKMKYFPLYYKIFINLLSVLFSLFYIFIIIFNGIKKNKKIVCDLVLIQKRIGYEDIFPEALKVKYPHIEVIDVPKRRSLRFNSKSVKIFARILLEHPFSFNFHMYALQELGRYSCILSKYDTDAIACYADERNVVSPLLSYMIEHYDVKHISFMHGEYIFQLYLSFMRYSEYYVWDEHYVKLLGEDMYCPKEQMKIYTPIKYKRRFKTGNEKYYCTYYFGAESIDRIERVAEVFNILKKQGKLCKVRPHPRRSNYEAINRYFDGFYIEDTHVKSVDESIEESKYIVALISTVLVEAYYGGKEVVIDDISEPERFKSMRKRKYILFSKPHKLFSEII